MLRPALLVLAALLAAQPGAADILVTTRTIKAQDTIARGDIALAEGEGKVTLEEAEALIGREAKVTLYVGRPIRLEDTAAAALVERNQSVDLAFRAGGLLIRAEGRALDRGAPGETIRVMNAASHVTLSAVVQPDGSAIVKR